jgi:hypothetical protein
MSIYINVNQQTSGPFEENAVTAWLQAGQLSPEVLACQHGATQWRPLRDVLTVATQPGASNGAGSQGASPALAAPAIVDWARKNFQTPVVLNHKFGAVRNDFARSLDAEGVERCGGQKHRWQDLQYVGYRQERLGGSPLQALIKALMYRGSERVTVKLAFTTGELIIPAFIQNHKELLGVLETIPAPRQKF